MPLDHAERLLIDGFVKQWDHEKQKQFMVNVPCPELTKIQTDYLDKIKNGNREEKRFVLKRINAEARAKTRDWNNYLSHPQTTSLLIDLSYQTTDKKVYQEVVWALAFICKRHLPDIRCEPVFLEALRDHNANVRWIGLLGLEGIYEFPRQAVQEMLNDRSKKVREYAALLLTREEYLSFPAWMFDEGNF